MNHPENFPLLFERSRAGRLGYSFPALDVPPQPLESLVDPRFLRSEPPALPEVSEVDVIRHYVNLSRRNYGVDLGFYPLGSCTMKYNPKGDEEAAALPGFSALHPLQPEHTTQGILALMHDLLGLLAEITGMSWGTLQPFAGAHGEFAGMQLFRACFRHRGEPSRRKMLVPDSAHGTNPASAHLAGFEVVQLKSDARGLVSPEALREHLNGELAGIMMTNPNTLGLFERDICRVAELVHGAGGLLYYDGANLNAIVGKVRPGDMGFDVVHLNLHKTFSTPHGGGGPGAGPVLVNETLRPYLPVPDVVKRGERYGLEEDRPHSIGRLAGFYGNVGVLVRAYAYILSMGSDGLAQVAERAVLNANYLKARLKDLYPLASEGLCKHEFVLSAPDPEGALRGQRPGHRQAPAGLRHPPAHGLLPADRARSPDDRAHGDRIPGNPGRLRGGHGPHPGRDGTGAGAPARGPDPHAGAAHRRGAGRQAADPALAAGRRAAGRRGQGEAPHA